MSLLENLQKTLWKGSSDQSPASHNRQLSGNFGFSGKSCTLVSLPLVPTYCAFPEPLAETQPHLTAWWVLKRGCEDV